MHRPHPGPVAQIAGVNSPPLNASPSRLHSCDSSSAPQAPAPTVAIAQVRDVAGYDAATGRKRWTVPLIGEVCAASSRPVGGQVVVRFGEERIGCHRVALIETGRKGWEETITPNDPVRRVVAGLDITAPDTAVSTRRAGSSCTRRR